MKPRVQGAMKVRLAVQVMTSTVTVAVNILVTGSKGNCSVSE